MDNRVGIYIISTGSMQTHPANKRSSFTNKLPKPLTLSIKHESSLFLSLESIAIENSIIQYPSVDRYPDLLIWNPVTKSIQSNFKIPEVHFEKPANFVSHMKSSTIDIFFKSLDIKGGKIHIQMIRKYILVSRRLFDFLRVNHEQNVSKHGDWFC